MNRVTRAGWGLFKMFFGVLLLLGMSHSAMAQVTGSITGRVEDSSGGAVPGVKVTVTSLETGQARTVDADDSGNYRSVSLPVGRYEVKAEKAGFKAAVQTGITLVVGQQAVVNLSLEVGQVQQQVTVTSEAPLVNTTTASTSGLVEEQAVKELPLNGRSFDNLITLNAGTVDASSTKAAGAGAQQAHMFAVAGRHWYENLFLVNGVEYMGPSQNHSEPGGPSGQLLGVDAVREFNVVADTYGAEYGKRAGGQISVVMASGTNALHGTAFEFIRNSILDARSFFDGPVIPPFKRNQFGGALGGPIKKDKTFIFGNYEGFRQRLGLTPTPSVPDNNARKGILPCNITTLTAAQCNAISLNNPTVPVYLGPAADGVLPASQSIGGMVGSDGKVINLDKRVLPYLNNWWPTQSPGQLDAGGVSKNSDNALQKIQEDFGVVRVDHNFSSKDQIGGTYLIDIGASDSPMQNIFASQVVPIRSQIISVQETHIFSPNLINTATLGYSRSAWHFQTPPRIPYNQAVGSNCSAANGTACITSDENWLVGAGNNYPGQFNVGGNGISVSGQVLSSAGTSRGTVTQAQRNLFTYADSLQIIHGRHQISTGVWFNALQSNEFRPTFSSGIMLFGGMFTTLEGLGSFSVAPIQTAMYWRQFEGAWFVQDNIQVKPNLSIRIGLRHEFNNGYNNPKNQATNYLFDPTTGILNSTPVIGHTLYQTNNALLLFAPRIGIAWDPFGKGKTSIRAGFGTYFNMNDEVGGSVDTEFPFNTNSTFGSTAAPVKTFDLVPVTVSGGNVTVPKAGGGTTPINPPCGVAVNGVTILATTANPANCTKYNPGGVDAVAKTPTVEEWSLAIEQQLSPNTSLRVAYVGSHGYHLLISANGNQIVPQFCANAAGCLAGGNAVGAPSPGAVSVPQGTLYVPADKTCTVIPCTTKALAPNPNLGAAATIYNYGTSSYNALQTELTHRYSFGLQGRVSYTWSRNLDEESGYSGDTSNEGQIEDMYHLKLLNWGPSNVNRTHQFTASAQYALPFGKGKHFGNAATGVEDQIIGGWQVNFILSVLSGFPFTPQIGINYSGDGAQADRVSANPAWSGPVINPNPKAGACGIQWINAVRDASCNVAGGTPGAPGANFPFTLPLLGTYGSYGRDSLIGPNMRELDLSLFKNFTITERIKLQFRAEGFNVLNRANFGAPSLAMFSGSAAAPLYNGANAGVITTLSTDPRRIQFGLKLNF